jgi:inhibitor of cysteine peptidase
MGACTKTPAGSAPSEVNITVSGDEFAANNHIIKATEVAPDGTITVTLSSNATTGFSWSETAQISNASVLEQTKHEFIAPTNSNIVGAPGNEVWTFKALKKGTTTVEMQYSRPWEGGEKGEWSFQLTVTIK